MAPPGPSNHLAGYKKEDPLYEDVPMNEEKEDEGEGGASPRPPPKPPDDSKDSSIETDRDIILWRVRELTQTATGQMLMVAAYSKLPSRDPEAP
ncbi:hypothetical protein AB1E18_005985 [Capra hircus]